MQAEAFNLSTAPLIEEVMSGYTAALIAYGQSGESRMPTFLAECITTLTSSFNIRTHEASATLCPALVCMLPDLAPIIGDCLRIIGRWWEDPQHDRSWRDPLG